MDELEAVRELLSEPAPTPEAVASGRAQLQALLAVQDSHGERSTARWRGRWWRPVRNGLIGAAAAIAVALAVAVPSDSLRISPDPDQELPSARQVLLTAAGAMARAPADGAYWRTGIVTGQLFLSPDRRYVIERRSEREIWLRRYGGRDRWTGRYLGAHPATAKDEQAWREAGEPGRWRYPADVAGLGRISPQALVQASPGVQQGGIHRVGWRNADGILTKQLVTWKALGTVPADPARLRAFLVSAIVRENGAYVGREMEAELRDTCLELITALPVPPEVRAAAYEILASIPGMRAEGQVTDPLGRTGQALGYQVVREGRLTDERLVVDPGSGLPLAQQTTNPSRTADGRDVEVGYFTAYQQIGWTDEEPTP
ncbi:CU044_5270 family protein [Nonomuraea sediminis]|uniref:CU044_5270 family protein n=1 Tax=Nonomuraea sediminis TaxID=2835864 RepID=UPI001BDD826B|nr:CU044_5270 family protein [Nonomuraea sediminis]